MQQGSWRIRQILDAIHARAPRSWFGRYQLAFDFSALLSNGVILTQTARVDSEASFLWVGQTAALASSTAATAVLTDFSREIMVRFTFPRTSSRLGSHRALSTLGAAPGSPDGWIPLAAICGLTGGYPGYWPYPVRLRPSESVVVDAFIPDDGGGTPARLNLSLIGVKHYEGSPA